MEKQITSRLAMTWKDRQRTRLPLVDLDDNPFCVERRTNEEWHMMQLNKVRERSEIPVRVWWATVSTLVAM